VDIGFDISGVICLFPVSLVVSDKASTKPLFGFFSRISTGSSRYYYFADLCWFELVSSFF
jgi:hypothetical protein